MASVRSDWAKLVTIGRSHVFDQTAVLRPQCVVDLFLEFVGCLVELSQFKQ